MKGEVAGIPLLLIFTAAFVIAAAVLQQATGFRPRLYAVGAKCPGRLRGGRPGHPDRRRRLHAERDRLRVAGLMLVGYSDGATLRMGDSYLLPTIARSSSVAPPSSAGAEASSRRSVERSC